MVNEQLQQCCECIVTSAVPLPSVHPGFLNLAAPRLLHHPDQRLESLGRQLRELRPTSCMYQAIGCGLPHIHVLARHTVHDDGDQVRPVGEHTGSQVVNQVNRKQDFQVNSLPPSRRRELVKLNQRLSRSFQRATHELIWVVLHHGPQHLQGLLLDAPLHHLLLLVLVLVFVLPGGHLGDTSNRAADHSDASTANFPDLLCGQHPRSGLPNHTSNPSRLRHSGSQRLILFAQTNQHDIQELGHQQRQILHGSCTSRDVAHFGPCCEGQLSDLLVKLEIKDLPQRLHSCSDVLRKSS
mmetsp:Transcript_27834/g.66951  ORF Transcript_27834/g.66951 Transcript_27834/m.66951 type:complete len:296 (-) Transcript_27834:2026-2913(-)